MTPPLLHHESPDTDTLIPVHGSDAKVTSTARSTQGEFFSPLRPRLYLNGSRTGEGVNYQSLWPQRQCKLVIAVTVADSEGSMASSGC